MKTIKTNKPREVFAWYEHGGTCFDCDFDVLKKEGTVSFVEKSAYDELQKKLEIATNALESIGKLTMSSYLSLKDLIEDKMFVAQEALKQIEDKNEND